MLIMTEWLKNIYEKIKFFKFRQFVISGFR